MYPPLAHPEARLPADVASRFEALVERDGLELPVLPDAAAVILSETARADWSAARVVETVTRDAALASHLLRLANSPAFRGASPIVSIQQAVTRLGGAQLRQAAIVIACETRAFVAPGYEELVRGLFRHALATALICREIARQRRTNVEEAFLAGLLHDIGWPVIIHALVDLGAVDRDAVLARAEALHAAVGARVARAWRVPEAVARAIGMHHGDTDDVLAATVSLADTLAQHAAAPSTDVAWAALPSTRTLNLYAETLDALARRSPALFAEASTW